MPAKEETEPEPPAAPLSIIVPVHDEEAVLPATVPLLLSGLPERAEIVYVCNGCTDGSAGFLRAVDDPRLAVIELTEPGKAGAICAGERHCSAFPRFFIDADVAISGADVARLAAYLRYGEVDLVTPQLKLDLSRASFTAAAAAKIWRSLPHGQSAAFQQVIGVSRAGRARWGEMPDITCDDSFIASHFAGSERMIADDIAVTVRPPATFAAIIGVRLRILKGLAELERLGISRPHAPGQRGALLKAILHPATVFGAFVHVAARLIAGLLFALGFGHGPGWYRDEGSR